MIVSGVGPRRPEPSIGRGTPRLFHRDRIVRRNRRIVLLVVIAAVGLTAAVLTAPARSADIQAVRLAAPVPANAQAYVQQLGDRVLGLLNRPGLSQEHRARRLEAMFTEAFDVPGMARFAAGRYWRATGDALRRDYVAAFGRYVASLYAVRFSEYAGQTFAVEGERGVAEGVTSVQVSVRHPAKKPTRLDFRVRRGDEGFRISDVSVEGLSLLITKRDEFSAILSNGGMANLVEKLRRLSRS